MLLGLVLVVFFIANGKGFFSNLQKPLQDAPQPSQTTADTIPESVSVTLQTSSGSTGALGTLATGAFLLSNSF